MHCRILTVTQKLPAWLETGYLDYLKRFSKGFQIQLIEVPLEKRTTNKNVHLAMEKEGERILSLIKPQHYVIALDVQGEIWSTEMLATQMQTWQTNGLHIDLLIGGPDGLAPQCLQRANAKWSLSKLTFPHHLVRLLLIEQLYRAHTILIDHPYHRG